MADPLLELVGVQQAQPSRGGPDPLLSMLGVSPAASQPSIAPVQTQEQPGQLDRPLLSQVGDAASAFTQHLLKIPRGIDQAVTNVIGKAASYLPSNPVSQALMDAATHKNQYVAEQERQYQASTPDSAGAYAGATAGEVAPFLVGGVAKGLQGAGDYIGGKVGSMLPNWLANYGNKIASGVTQGTILGAAQPVTDAGESNLSSLVTGQQGPSYWERKGRDIKVGALIGGATPAATELIGGAYKGLKNAAMPILNPQQIVAPTLNKMIGNEHSALIDALRNPEELVPGSKPTLAQIAPNPSTVAAEKAMMNNPTYRPIFDAQNNLNNEARLAAIGEQAGTPEMMAAALKARTEAANPFTNGVLKQGKPVDATPILDQLRELRASPLGVRSNIGAAARDIIKTIEDRAGIDGSIQPGQLDAIRQNVRDFLSQHSTNGVVGSQQEVAFEPVKRAITDAIEGANPGYRAYLADYAKNSVPINTMEAAGSILKDVGGGGRSLNSAGDAQVMLQKYSTALKKAVDNAPYGIDPKAKAALEAVQSDLQRATISNSVKSAGSDTAYNLQAPGWMAGKLYGKDFTGTPQAAKLGGALLGGLGGLVTGGGFGAAGGATAGAALGNKIANLGQSKVNSMMAKALADPQYAAKLIEDMNTTVPGKVGPWLTQRIPQTSILLGQQLRQLENK